jgi:hypothetical protein
MEFEGGGSGALLVGLTPLCGAPLAAAWPSSMSRAPPGPSPRLLRSYSLLFFLSFFTILFCSVHNDIRLDSIQLIYHRVCCTWREQRVPTPIPHSCTRKKAGRNHLNEEIQTPLPHWDRRAIQTFSNLGHAGGWGALVNSVLWGKEQFSQVTKYIGLTVEALDTPWYGYQKLHVEQITT